MNREAKKGKAIKKELDRDAKITVCESCKRACCWQGVICCENHKTAGTIQMTVKDLRALDLENECYWRREREQGVAGKEPADEIAILHAELRRLREGVRCPSCDHLQLEIGDLCAEVARLKRENDQLNALARQAGWGQGEIDSGAGIAEENEKLIAQRDQAEADAEELRNILEKALFSFECTQPVEIYPTDHWCQRATRILSQPHPSTALRQRLEALREALRIALIHWKANYEQATGHEIVITSWAPEETFKYIECSKVLADNPHDPNSTVGLAAEAEHLKKALDLVAMERDEAIRRLNQISGYVYERVRYSPPQRTDVQDITATSIRRLK